MKAADSACANILAAGYGPGRIKIQKKRHTHVRTNFNFPVFAKSRTITENAADWYTQSTHTHTHGVR